MSYFQLGNNLKVLNFSDDASNSEIQVNTNLEELLLFSSDEWLEAYWNAQSQTISVNVAQNTKQETRSGILRIEGGNLTKELTVHQLGIDPVMMLNTNEWELDYNPHDVELIVTSNVDLKLSATADWLSWDTGKKADAVSRSYRINVDLLPSKVARSSYIRVYNEEYGLKDSVLFVQSLNGGVKYVPGDPSGMRNDVKLKVNSVSVIPAGTYQPGQGPEHTLGSEKIYHSPWSGMKEGEVIALEYIFDPSAEVLNYIVLKPRSSGGNGVIKQANIWVTTQSEPEYKLLKTIDVPFSNGAVLVEMPAPVLHPLKLKVEVLDSYSHDGKKYVSLDEFEAYRSSVNEFVESDLQFFTDWTFSELRPGFSTSDLPNIQNPFIRNIAAFMLSGEYSSEYRIQNYEPFNDLKSLLDELKLSAYNAYENITGIYFEKNEKVLLFVEDAHGQDIKLRVKDWMDGGEDHLYPLVTGINVLQMKSRGNGYISYYTPDYESLPDVKIHIASGQVNGFIDRHTMSNQEAREVLDHAVSEVMDLRSDLVHLAYTVDALKKYSYNQSVDLLAVYDSLINIQHHILGHRKYNRLPKNRMFGRVVWNGFMYADGKGAGFNESTMAGVANAEAIWSDGNWGVAHEFGHVNQLRPGMRWVGTTEVTNNIYSIYSQYLFSEGKTRLEHKSVGGEIGGRFNAYLNNALVKNQEWGLQAGPGGTYGEKNGKWKGDVFVSLCMFWQLHLYYHIAGEGQTWHHPYFWADIFEELRQNDYGQFSHGDRQVRFAENAMHAVKADLSEYFVNTGVLQTVDKFVDDYRPAQKNISTEMIDRAIATGSGYPKPEAKIEYISVNSLNAYKNQLPVTGSFGEGITFNNGSQRISHQVWKNVAVFKTYKDQELLSIGMVGTGSTDNTFTDLKIPTGTTRVEAVAFDGTETLVYGER